MDRNPDTWEYMFFFGACLLFVYVLCRVLERLGLIEPWWFWK